MTNLRLLIVSAVMSVLLPASARDLWLSPLSRDGSLSNIKVNSAVRSSDGYVWVGTLSELMRHDGFSFRPYYIFDGPASHEGGNDVDFIVEDASGRLWLKSHSRWFAYEPGTDRIIHDTDSIIATLGMEGTPTLVTVDRAQGLWVATTEGRVFHRPVGAESATEVDTGTFPPLKGKKVTGASDSRDGMVFITDRGELYCVGYGSRKVRWHDDAVARSLPADEAMEFTVLFDRGGLGWIYTYERMWLYDTRSRAWVSDRLPSGGRAMVVKVLLEDDAGRLWLGRDHHGLELVDRSAHGITFHRAATGDLLPPTSTVTSLWKDASGMLLVGTYKHGVFFLDDSANVFSLVEAPDVNCIYPSPDGRVWMGTDASGLFVLDPSAGRAVPVVDPSDTVEPCAVTALTGSADGRDIYVGSFSRGLRKVTDGKFTHVTTSTPLDAAYVWSFAPASAGRLWVGTLTDGIFLYDPADGSAKHWNSGNSALESDCVQTLATAADGTLYAGTPVGVAELKAGSDSVRMLDARFGGTVNALTVDSRGLVWIASQRGLDVYDPSADSVIAVHYSPSAYSRNPLGLREDKEGCLWVADGPDLYRLTVEYTPGEGVLDVDARSFDVRDGLRGGSFNQRSMAMLPDGEMLVGGLYGVTRFNPADITVGTSAPRTLFSTLSIDDRIVTPGQKVGGRVALPDGLRDGARVELGPSTDGFTLSLGTDSYILPGKTRFSYKLEGFDTKWTQTPEGVNTVTYLHLPPGSYRLLVKSTNGEGVESSGTAVLEITVHPPFYLTVWAKAVYVILILAAVWMFFILIRRRERRRFNERRRQDAAKKEDELNRLKFRFFTNIGHDLRTPLTLILSPLDAMLKEATDDSQRRRLGLMKKNAGHLLDMVNQLLDFRKSDVSALTVKKVDSDMALFLSNVCRSFSMFSTSKDISLDYHSDVESVPMRFDEDKLYKVMMNLLGNAFKFTPAGGKVSVTLSLGEGGRNAVIKVADTGCGIPDSEKGRIFERFYQSPSAHTDKASTGYGIGLSLVQEYVTLHDGSISVSDNAPCGTVFTVTIPVVPSSAPVSKSETPEAEAPAPEAVRGDSAPAERPTALVVDDNPDMLEFLKDGLSAAFRVVTAPDGEAALKLLDSVKPSIVVTDIMMPRMDGVELCRRIKGDPSLRGIPVVALSAKSDEQAKVEMFTIGADDYLTKPFNIELLILRMKRLVALTSASVPGRRLIDPEPGSIDITPLDEKMVEKAIKYVVANMKRTDLSVEELSSYLGMSRVHFYKKMKAVTGKTPIEFIRLMRLKRSAQLLRESQLNISEVAYQVGFNSPKYFTRYFKEEFGMLPSEYKEAKEQATFRPL